MTPPSNSSYSPERPGFDADGKPLANQFRVLIVDDQPANRLILSRLLNMTGYLTCEASDGHQALQCIETHKIDLVIMDVEMPNMDGLEAIRLIRKLSDPRKASLPIMAATGNPQPETGRELLDSGANAFLTKPFDTRILLKMATRLLLPTPDPGKKQSGQRTAKSDSVTSDL